MSAACGTAFSACSGTTHYELCSEHCGSGGNAGSSGANAGAPTAGGAPANGGSGSDPGGDGGELANPAGGESGAAEFAGGSAGAHGGESGAAGAGGEGGGSEPLACDPSKSPLDEPCLVNDEFAVFVGNDTGKDSGEGSASAPFSRLSRALEVAGETGRIVLVCQGAHPDRLEVVGAKPHRIRVFGGFVCGDGWKVGSGATTIQPPSGPALHLDGAHDVEFNDLSFAGVPARAMGENSIAAVVEGSSGIVFNRVELLASTGENGQAGAAAPARASKAPAGNVGMLSGGAAAQTACPCESVGGRGGDRSAAVTRDGSDGQPDLGAGDGGKGGSTCDKGELGASGAPGEPGLGASTQGTFDGVTWLPSPGTPGAAGSVAQGGGGGGGKADGGGGSGACGGCGGKGGEPGKGGGSSIALLMIDSEVTLSGCSIFTDQAGHGGPGGAGQPGQEGGDSGPHGGGCNGGPGGTGGTGGPGGGGAGGISVGVLFRGEMPVVTGTTWSLGEPGDGGDGGDATPMDGTPGVKADQLGI